MGRPLALFGVPAILCGVWTVVAGKDLNWDLLHYHYYIAHSLLNGRFAQDYFAAGTESYLNPIGYVPFYLMASAGWHSVLVSVMLAALHGASLALLYVLAWTLFRHHPWRQRTALSALAAAVGAASAVFWASVGTSFLDPLLAVPMLGGVVLLARAQPADAIQRSAWAGVLFGAAAALKYSNAFYALAAMILCIAIPGIARSRRLRAVAAFAGGGALAVAVLAGPWLARLAREFGNPFFPHLNALFRSPEAPPFMLVAERFAPQDLADALAFPFRLISPESMIYAEMSAPDLRFAVLAFAGSALGLASLVPRVRANSSRASFVADDVRIFCFFLVCLVAWVATSANARYGMLVLLLVGPCLARVLDRFMPLRYVYLALLLLLACQIVVCAVASPARWFIAEPWSQNWFPFVAPERARIEPALYLTIEPQAMTAVVPFLHRDSAFVSLRGRPSPSQGSGRLERLLERGERPVRALGRGLRLQEDGKPRPEVIEEYDSKLIRFGFRVDVTDCFSIPWRAADQHPLSRWANMFAVQREARDRVMSLASCALVRAERDPRDLEEERRVSAVFDRIEQECRGLLRGQMSVTERLGPEWSRTYAGLEARMETRSGRVVLVPWFKLVYLDLGSLAAWERDTALQAASCRKARLTR